MTRDFIASMFRAVDAKDWEGVGRHFHPDIVYQRPGFPVLSGREAVVRFYRETRQIHGEHRAEGMAVDGEFGAAWGRFVGTKKDGSPVDVQYADCYVFADGLIKHRKSHFFVSLGV
jgi:uncharacterized protein